MIEKSEHRGVTRYRLGREILGKVQYWTSCFWLDGLLIDTGCAHTAGELLEELRPRGVEIIVNTHYHEDHVGGNALLSRELKAPLLAPAASLPLLARPPWPRRRFSARPWARWSRPCPACKGPSTIWSECKGASWSCTAGA